MIRKSGSIIVSMFVLLAQLQAQQIIDSLVAPESVLKVGDKIFVSNAGGGFLSELSVDGKFIHKNFQKGVLHSPKGLAVMSNVIYVTDTDRVVGFNINSREQVFELGVAKSTFLNDLCTAGKNELVVTESHSGNVYL